MSITTSLSKNGEISCSECRMNIAIYQCPCCLTRTCSLQCCTAHKVRTGCSGKRNRGSFLPVSKMTDSTIRSDYFFLEEILQQIPRDNSRKRPRLTHQHIDAPTTTTPPPTNKKSRRLLEQAGRRGITLRIMPETMVRHKSNSSWYCGPRDLITWTIELIVYPTKIGSTFQVSEGTENIMDLVITHCQKEGVTISNESHFLFMMILPSISNQPRYIKVDPKANLKTILRGTTIIEYPTFHCVPQEMMDQFPTDSDKITLMDGECDSTTVDIAEPPTMVS